MSGARSLSELETIILAPLLHRLDDVLNLRVLGILQHLNYFNKTFLALLSSDNLLEHSDCSSSLTFPELWICVQSLEHVECLHGEVELAHLVAVVSDQVQKRQTLVRRLHIDVNLPSEVRLLVHNVRAAKP